RLEQDLGVVGERPRPRQDLEAEDLPQRLERGEQHPHERERHRDAPDREHEVGQGAAEVEAQAPTPGARPRRGGSGGCGPLDGHQYSTLRCVMRSWRSVTAMMITNSSTVTAAA